MRFERCQDGKAENGCRAILVRLVGLQEVEGYYDAKDCVVRVDKIMRIMRYREKSLVRAGIDIGKTLVPNTLQNLMCKSRKNAKPPSLPISYTHGLLNHCVLPSILALAPLPLHHKSRPHRINRSAAAVGPSTAGRMSK